MKKITAFVAALALVSPAFSQTPPKRVPRAVATPAVPVKAAVAEPIVATAAPGEAEAESPEKIIARFFSYLQRREVDQAYDQLTRGTRIAERVEDVKTLKAKTKEAITVFGPIIGYDSVSNKQIGTRLVSYTVISLGKEFPLRWRFYFYKPQDAWRLIDLRVDDRLAAMFDETEEARTREERP